MLKVSIATAPFGPEPAAGSGTGAVLAASDSTPSTMFTKACSSALQSGACEHSHEEKGQAR